MNFTCDVLELNNALSVAIHAIPVKSPKPVLEGLQISTEDNEVVITSTDMAIGIECRINAVIHERGSVVVSGRFFCDIARKLPDDTVNISVNDRYITTITSGDFRTSIPGMDALEFPELPNVKGINMKISQKRLKKMIDGTLFAVATDESRPILTGCLFENEDNNFSVVALDGYRLAIRNCMLEEKADNFSAVIGGKNVSDISKILSDTDDPVEITFSRSHACLKIDRSVIIVRLLEGEYMRYKQIIPEEYQTRIICNRGQLTDAIDRGMLIARVQNIKTVNFKIAQDVLTVGIPNANTEEKVSIHFEGKDLEIAFNIKYVMDVLKSISGSEVDIRFRSNVNPCIFYPTDEEKYLYLILPVRV